MASTSSYRLTCLCGAVSEPASLLLSDTIPVLAPEICHCNPCRFTTGALGGSFPKLRSAPSPESLSKCVGYDSSATHRRWHCERCGCAMWIEAKLKEEWLVCAGVIDRVDGGEGVGGEGTVRDVVRVERHDFLSDTGDGGLVPRLLRLGKDGEQREIVCWDMFPDSRRVSPEEVQEMERKSVERGKDKPGRDEKLQLKCHCGGVDLRIKRADYATDTQGVSERYIPPDKEKYIALFCVCRSCRLATGISLQPWCYIPPANITIASTGKQVVLGKNREATGANAGTTLKHFNSSSDVYRSFCRTCGATVFYWADELGHAMVDVSVGLLRGEEGVMARRWLDWAWGRVICKEEAVDGEVLEAILGNEGKERRG